MALAGIVCAAGIYASVAIGSHAARSIGTARAFWGAVGVLASGCTAWATHFIALLAFRPGMASAFDPELTAISLLCAIIGIAFGVSLSIRTRRLKGQFMAGLAIGTGVAMLHYIGQAAYLVQGSVHWDHTLVLLSIACSLPLSGLATMAAGSRIRPLRHATAPLLLLAIAVLHFCGMAAMTLHHDHNLRLPPDAVSPSSITPVVAGVSLAIVALAVFGWRLDLVASARLRHDRRRLRELADVALEGLLICRGGEIVTVNASMEQLSEHQPGALTGKWVGALLPALDVTHLPEREERETELVSAGGQRVPVRVLRREVELGRTMHTVIAVRDQRERLRTEAKMRTLAFNDPLTGLPNRTRFFDLLALHTASLRAPDRFFAVLMIDIDRFKPVNDTLGHAAGDMILRKVADRLRSIVREGDVIARLGGDEFAVLATGTQGIEAAEALSARIIEVIGAEPFLHAGQSIHIGASIGLAWSQEDGSDPAELLRNADLALYAAKADGRATYRRYDAVLDEQMNNRHSVEAGLRRALREGHLELHYQPLVGARSQRVTAAEALVRWRDPERGLVPPSEFIALAEDTGLILPLGEWVLQTACAQAATWPDDIDVAVNLSPAQFRDPRLVAMVQAALEAAQLAPSRLELEITEGVLLMDEKRTLDTLSQLRAMGVRISMDDFGTGYSSLSYLRRFPFDKIKIDQSFIQQIPDQESAAIIRAIITMGACLGMTTTVEGVETAEQFAFCVAEGCDTVQGYHVSRPLEPAVFVELVASANDLRMAS